MRITSFGVTQPPAADCRESRLEESDFLRTDDHVHNDSFGSLGE